MELYHASKEIVTYPEIRKAKYTKDFSWGFYCTNNMKQAIRWANRGIGEPIINYYDYEPNEELKILRFPEISDDWLDFIAQCRSGKTHTYDIVEGPMEDDQVWDYVEDYVAGNISKAAFWELVKFKYPTHKIVFCTEQALETISFEGSENL